MSLWIIIYMFVLGDGNERLGSIKWEEFIEELGHYQLLKDDRASGI